MEQRPENPEPAVLGAGIDPSYIPGLPGAAVSSRASDESPAAEDGPGTDDAANEEPPARAAEDVEADGEREDLDERDDPDDEEPPEGPSFEVRDHRGAIIADGRGLVFRLDDTEARFRWSDIGSVEIGASRFGKRFEVAVGTREPRRRFDAEVIAPTRKHLQQWTDDLDAVLDVWFEDDAK